jgi:hypothetical protein
VSYAVNEQHALIGRSLASVMVHQRWRFLHQVSQSIILLQSPFGSQRSQSLGSALKYKSQEKKKREIEVNHLNIFFVETCSELSEDQYFVFEPRLDVNSMENV